MDLKAIIFTCLQHIDFTSCIFSFCCFVSKIAYTKHRRYVLCRYNNPTKNPHSGLCVWVLDYLLCWSLSLAISLAGTLVFTLWGSVHFQAFNQRSLYHAVINKSKQTLSRFATVSCISLNGVISRRNHQSLVVCCSAVILCKSSVTHEIVSGS